MLDPAAPEAVVAVTNTASDSVLFVRAMLPPLLLIRAVGQHADEMQNDFLLFTVCH